MAGRPWARAADWTRSSPPARSAIGVAATIVFVAVILLILDAAHVVSIAFMVQWWPFLVGPATTALLVTTVSFAVGFFVAIPLGLVRAYGPNTIRRKGRASLAVAPLYGLTSGYVEAIRGTPAFVQILLLSALATRAFRGLPDVELWAGVLALTVNTIGYQAEVFRAGFQSIGQGQIEAAKAIGMRPFQTFVDISLPQSLRLVILPLANEWIGLFKASALLWYVAVKELMWAGNYLGYTQVRPVEALFLVASFYLVIIIPLGRGVSYLERKIRIPGLGVPEPGRGARRRREPGPAPTGGARAGTSPVPWIRGLYKSPFISRETWQGR